jgi:hypothetical protein
MPRAYVIDMVCAITSAVRDRLLATPAKIAHRIAIVSKPAECERLLTQEITECLETISSLEITPVAWRGGQQRSGSCG